MKYGTQNITAAYYGSIKICDTECPPCGNIFPNPNFSDGTYSPWYPQTVGGNDSCVLSIVVLGAVEPPPSDNPYLEPVDIPTYDNGDSTHRVITTSDTNISDILNDSQYQHFYIEPGDYSSERWELTLSGTDTDRRTISLHNGNDTHPGLLPMDSSNLANIRVDIDANYWTLDRMCGFDNYDSGEKYEFDLKSGSSFNILNRLLTFNNSVPIALKEECHNNTIQKCSLKDMTLGTAKADNPAIIFIAWDVPGIPEFKNNKIILNEMRNCTDGVMTMAHVIDGETDVQDINGEGTIIDSNKIWINSDLYTDGSGNLDPNGEYAYAENAIDLKFGSHNQNNPMVITNNEMWGYRRSDTTGSSLSDYGSAIVVHYGIQYIEVEDNIFYDSARAFTSTDSRNFDYALHDSTLSNNLMYECGYKGAFSSNVNMAIGEGNNVVMQYNAIIKPSAASGEEYYAKLWFSSDLTFNYNDIVDAEGYILYLESESGGNYEPNTQGTAVELGYTEDVVIEYDIYTNSPQQHVLTNAAKLGVNNG